MAEFRGRRPGSGDGEEAVFSLEEDTGEQGRLELPPFQVRRYRRLPGRTR